MLLYLVRHGQSTNNAGLPRVPDAELTELGVEQARYAAKALRGAGLTHLHASPTRRAMHTAAIIGEAVGLPVRIAPEFCEVGGVVGAPGLSRAEILKLYPTSVLAENITDAGWWLGPEETIQEGYQRAVCALQTLRGLYEQDEATRVCLVTHGTFGSFLLAAFLGVPFAAMGADRGIRVNLCNAGLSLFETEPGILRIAYLNRFDHLPPEMVTGWEETR